MKNKISEALIQSVHEVIRQDVEINENTKLMTDIMLESIDFVEILFLTEKKLNIRIDMNELYKFMTENNLTVQSAAISHITKFIELNVR